MDSKKQTLQDLHAKITRADYLDDSMEQAAGHLNTKVNFEIRRLRRWGLTQKEIHETILTAVDFILNHEEGK